MKAHILHHGRAVQVTMILSKTGTSATTTRTTLEMPHSGASLDVDSNEAGFDRRGHKDMCALDTIQDSEHLLDGAYQLHVLGWVVQGTLAANLLRL